MSEALELYRKQKKLDQIYEQMQGVSVMDYITDRSPKTASDLMNILAELPINCLCEAIKVYHIGPEMYPHYEGVKILIKYPFGTRIVPPGKGELIYVQPDASLGRLRTLLISKFKQDDGGTSV